MQPIYLCLHVTAKQMICIKSCLVVWTIMLLFCRAGSVHINVHFGVHFLCPILLLSFLSTSPTSIDFPWKFRLYFSCILNPITSLYPRLNSKNNGVCVGGVFRVIRWQCINLDWSYSSFWRWYCHLQPLWWSREKIEFTLLMISYSGEKRIRGYFPLSVVVVQYQNTGVCYSGTTWRVGVINLQGKTLVRKLSPGFQSLWLGKTQVMTAWL